MDEHENDQEQSDVRENDSDQNKYHQNHYPQMLKKRTGIRNGILLFIGLNIIFLLLVFSLTSISSSMYFFYVGLFIIPITGNIIAAIILAFKNQYLLFGYLIGGLAGILVFGTCMAAITR